MSRSRSIAWLMVTAVFLGSFGFLGMFRVPAAEASHPPGGHTYTFDADFDQGSAFNVVHSIPDQLQLDDTSTPFPFIWVAASDRGTVVKIDTATGQVLGEYRTAPEGMQTNPSRTTVDKDGNVWTGNRNEATGNQGSAVHIGLMENGQCQDRNGNGLIDTSTGLGDIRPWSNQGGLDADGGVDTAEDECIIHFVRTNAVRIRHVSVDQDNNVWLGGGAFGDAIGKYDLVSDNGVILRSIDTRNPAESGEPGPIHSCCYGGLVSPDGTLWGAALADYILRIDPSQPNGHTDLIQVVPLGRTSYGMGIDSQGNIWVSNFGYGSVQKVSPAGVLLGTFPITGTGSRGVAVTPDDHVWIANSSSNNVSRVDNSGSVVATIPVGITPTGISVDAAGKVWVTNLSSNNAMRIDPATDSVDLTVSLGAGAGPYNYSDMTGSILIGPPTEGTWSVVHDSGMANAVWSAISWHGDEFGDGSLQVFAASSADGITFGSEVAVSNGSAPAVAPGQYLKVSVRFNRATTGESPILYDLTVRPNRPPTVDLVPLPPIPEGSGPVVIQAIGTDPDGDPLTYSWSMSGPGTLSSAGGSTAQYFHDDGPAIAQVSVVVSDGQFTATASMPVEMFNLPPVVDAGDDKAEYWGLPVPFAGTATDPSPVDQAAGLNPTWAFGDGDTAMGLSASHAYADPGLYTATLTATDKDGGVGLDQVQVTITKRPTSLAYTGDLSMAFGFPGMLAAQLSDSVDAATADLAGRLITFVVDGHTLTAMTDAAGNASVAAPPGLMPGTYTVVVTFAEDSHYLASSTEATLQVDSTPGKVTGGSIQFETGGRGGFNVQSDGATVKGELQYQNGSERFHAHVMTALSVSPDGTKAWFAGVGNDGRTFTAYVEDNGEPGDADLFQLWIDGLLQTGDGHLSGGNIQIH